ncbi:MAG: 8-amino-7-oxononanoate synthase [Planctomycetales bacterium]|nr:8-amino-7-oxononanoate synthase [Planctomycetales bacterium]
MEPLGWVDEELARLERSDLLRTLPPPLRAAGATVRLDGRSIVNFSSNDYLGLASDERLIAAAAQACQDQGVGRGASPLVSGRAESHDYLERRLAAFFRTEAALLFPTSFAANAGIISALVEQGDAIYGDAKNHASIIDGCRLARAERHIYPHRDVAVLEQLLREGKHYRRRLIVTDSLFSMDGDLAPLLQIAALAEQYQAMLMVDEAHAIGVFGEHGRGVVEHLAAADPLLESRVHIRVGTFAKSLGSAGGFVCTSAALVKWLSNRARTYVFSTAQPAAVGAAGAVALDIVDAEPERRILLLEKAARLRCRLHERGWDTGTSASQIVPLRIGSPARTMQLSQRLRERGFWAPGIRPPSVPDHDSLIRLGITAAHTDEMLDSLVEALDEAREPA